MCGEITFTYEECGCAMADPAPETWECAPYKSTGICPLPEPKKETQVGGTGYCPTHHAEKENGGS
jgi:hypothetical protein